MFETHLVKEGVLIEGSVFARFRQRNVFQRILRFLQKKTWIYNILIHDIHVDS